MAIWLTRRAALQAAAAVLGHLAAGVHASEPVVTVHIREHRFEPAELIVKPGTTVRWVNDERRSSHSVLFKGEGGVESERMLPGESWQRRFDRPGRHAYICGPHPEMNGVIDVQA